MPAALLLFKAKVQGYDRAENVKHSKEEKKNNPPHSGDYFKCRLFLRDGKSFCSQNNQSTHYIPMLVILIICSLWNEYTASTLVEKSMCTVNDQKEAI